LSDGLYDRTVTRLTTAEPIVVAPGCVVCGGSRARPVFRIEGLASPLVICEECGTGFLHPLPSVQEIAEFYPPGYYGADGQKFHSLVEAAVRIVASRHVRFLARRVPAGGRVLDVGCGRGTALAALAGRGLEVHGMEISAAAAEGTDPRVRMHIAPRLEDVGLPANEFDLVMVWHVLEHLPQPAETLLEIHRLLKPGGRVVVAVPNFSSWQARWAGPDWFHLDPPRHLYHFPLAGLKRLLRRCGYDLEGEYHFSLRQNPFGWVQSWLNRYDRGPRNALYELLQRRSGTASLREPRRERWRLWSAFLLGMPVGLILELAATALRSGATVHVVARARK